MSKLPTSRLPVSPVKPVLRQPARPSVNVKPVNSKEENSSNNSIRIGDRVITSGKAGTVAFIGPTKFAEGEWFGLILDEAQGKNDGSHGGIRYFETDSNHGLFCRRDKVQHLSQNGPSGLSSSGDGRNASANNTMDSSSLKDLHIGDRVVVSGVKYGTLKYIGKIHIAEGIWCGIKLEGPLGKHNGKVDGTRYFHCQHRFGLFAPLRRVEKVIINTRESQTLSRQSIISTNSHNDGRSYSSRSQTSDMSEFSLSSASLDHFPSRSPSKTEQNFPSSEILQLNETVIQKNILIEELQQEISKIRLQSSDTRPKVDQMENHIRTLEQQYDRKKNENELLRTQQAELTRHLEDLQFQLEECQLTETNKEHLMMVDQMEKYEEIKKEFVELELMNQKLLVEKQRFEEELKRQNGNELEQKFNNQLQYETKLHEKEKQTNDLIAELRRQIELLKLQLNDAQNKEQSKTSQLSEKETFYKEQIKEYQSKIDQISKEEQQVRSQLTTLQQQQEVNEKRVNDLLTELKRYKESIIPELEKQCDVLKSELQNRDQTANMALRERESYYEQQIKEYQAYIDQATQETEKVRIELKRIQEENDLKEKSTKALVNELKQNYEKLQNELAEINDQEHQTNMTLDQRESEYEKQIKEYENNLNQATRNNENIQAELAKLAEETASHDKKSNHTIESLKQGYEKQYEILNTELTELQDRDHNQNTTLNAREAQYEIQIKEYQNKSEHDACEIQDLQSELTQLQQKKKTNENQVEENINTLKQDFEKQYEILKSELQNRDHTQNMTLNEREGQYETQIKDYQNKSEHDIRELQDLQSELTKLQAEKTANDKRVEENINTLKQNYEQQYKELQIELNDRERKANQTLHQRESEYEQRIKEYQDNLEQVSREIENIQSELAKVQEEKASIEKTLNDTIDSLKQDFAKQYAILQTELQNRDHNQNMTLNEREAQYETQIKEYQNKSEQDASEIQDLQSELTQLQEEKAVIEKQVEENINTLKQDYEQQCKELQTELNDRERKANKTLHQRESEYEQQIKEYQDNLEHASRVTENIQIELAKLQEEKASIEKKSSDRIESLKQDFEKQYEILKSELQDRDHNENITSNEREAQYETQIKDYQNKSDHDARETEDLRSELTALQEEKSLHETKLNETINTLKHDYESLQNELADRERVAKVTLKARAAEYEQQIDEYQHDLELAIHQTQSVYSQLEKVQEEKAFKENESVDTMNLLKQDFEEQIEILKSQNIQFQEHHQTNTEREYQLKFDELKKQNEIEINEQEKQLNQFKSELDQKQQANKQLTNIKQQYEQTQNELIQRTENLTTRNETLKQELQDLKNENEQLKTIDNDKPTENQTLIDQLTKQLDEFQQVYTDLLEKHNNMEQEYAENKKTQEKNVKEKVADYQMQIALMKSEYLVEMENTKLDHDQEMLRLKTLLQQAVPAKGKK